MSPLTYKWLHLIGLALTLLSLGAMSQGMGERKKALSISHGVGLFITLLGGFGMLAKYKISAMDPVIITKIILWLLLGACIALFKRKPELSSALWWMVFAIFAVAAYLGVHLRA